MKKYEPLLGSYGELIAIIRLEIIGLYGRLLTLTNNFS